MILHYFAAILSQAGYPATNILHSIGPNQGDGMAFFGVIEARRVETIISSSDCPCLHREVKMLLKKGVEFSIKRWGAYDDWSSMIVSFACNGCTLTPSERSTAEIVRGLLQEDARALSLTLEQQGRAIVKGTPDQPDVVREFRTREFLVRVIEVPDRHYNPLSFNLDALEVVEKIVSGEYRYFGVVVEIRALSTGALLGNDAIWGIVEGKDEPARKSGYYGNLKFMVSAAVREARIEINKPDRLAA